MSDHNKKSSCEELLKIYNSLVLTKRGFDDEYKIGCKQKDLKEAIKIKKEIKKIIFSLFETELYKKEPRKIIAIIYNCSQDQIVDKYEDIKDDTVGYIGNLDWPQWEKIQKHIKYVKGYLDINKLTMAEGLRLPEFFKGKLDLGGLTTAEGLRLPEHFNGGLFLDGLTTAEGLCLPEHFDGQLWLYALETAEGLCLPENFNGGLFLDGLTTAEGLRLPEFFKGMLNLRGLTTAVGLRLPKHGKGTVYLNKLTEAEKNQLKQQYPNFTIV